MYLPIFKWAQWWAKYDGDFSDFMLLLQQPQWLTLIIVAFIGIMRGQFSQCGDLSPLMMEQQWKSRIPAIASSETVIDNHQSITLSRPASRCPHCGHSMRWFEKICLLLAGYC